MMSTEYPDEDRFSIWQRQLAVSVAFAVLFALIVSSLFLQERRREWTLRQEQVRHRLDVACDLIAQEIDRIRGDALFLADQEIGRQFAAGDHGKLTLLRKDYVSFLLRKATYDQIRLLDLNGQELVRLNYSGQDATVVDNDELQDKSNRYYFRESRSLSAGELLVSEFDLNVEHGRIETPAKPVIRFVTPVVDDGGAPKALLVLNYLGERLLNQLDDASLPGFVMLLRHDGHYLHSPEPLDSWGWLMGHDRSFATQFPAEWANIDLMQDCHLTAAGAFASRRILLGASSAASAYRPVAGRDSIIAVCYLAPDELFVLSNKLLRKLLLLAGFVFVPVAVIARYWARDSLNRQSQSRRLRSLSSRLLRIQEDERRAISREIHDEFGQQVTAINLDLKLAERHVESNEARLHLQRAIRENEGLLQSLHAFATRVRPAVLDDLGLEDAIQSHIAEFQQRSGILVDADLQIDPVKIPDDIADNIYRLLQESLSNVLRHAEASKVWISLAIDQTNVNFVIRDNGRGYSKADGGGKRLGLVGMRERVDLLSGELRIESDSESGTNIEIKLPLSQVIAKSGENRA